MASILLQIYVIFWAIDGFKEKDSLACTILLYLIQYLGQKSHSLCVYTRNSSGPNTPEITGISLEEGSSKQKYCSLSPRYI